MDGPEPITADHRKFARALVALAREHGAGKLTATFSLASSTRFRQDGSDWTQVTLTWVEGRHADTSQVSLRAEAFDSFPELELTQ